MLALLRDLLLASGYGGGGRWWKKLEKSESKRECDVTRSTLTPL
jgi:hypothetical protein